MTLRTCIPLAVFLSLWLTAFVLSGAFSKPPNGKGFGGDFAIFVAASRVVASHGDPYDRNSVYKAERQMLMAERLVTPGPQSYIRVGNPPLLFWALQPLANMSFRYIALLWMLSMYALCGFGFWLGLRYLNWTAMALPVLAFLCMPQTVLTAYYGNLDGIIVGAIGLGLTLLKRYPVTAGAILSISLLKPQLAVPILLLMIGFVAPSWRRTFLGLCAALSGWLLLSLIVTGPHVFFSWLSALLGYSQELQVQPDIASLSGLYIYWAGPVLRIVISAGILATACVITGLFWWRYRRSSVLRLGWLAPLWFVWFLATPFAHYHDQVVLAFPVAAVLGRNAMDIARAPQAALVYSLVLSLLLFPTLRTHTDLQALALIGSLFFCYVSVPVRFTDGLHALIPTWNIAGPSGAP